MGYGTVTHSCARLLCLSSQLVAGSEHIIAGKTVRVNVAGPRPELPLLYLQPGRVQQPMAPPPPPAGESSLSNVTIPLHL